MIYRICVRNSCKALSALAECSTRYYCNARLIEKLGTELFARHTKSAYVCKHVKRALRLKALDTSRSKSACDIKAASVDFENGVYSRSEKITVGFLPCENDSTEVGRLYLENQGSAARTNPAEALKKE